MYSNRFFKNLLLWLITTIWMVSGSGVVMGKNADLPTILTLQANGQTKPITLTSQDRLVVTVQATPRSKRPSRKSDWWILAVTPFGLYGYDGKSKLFLEGIALAGQSPLFNEGQPLTILDYTGLAIGDYYLYFGADLVSNGALDTSLGYQQIAVHVIPSEEEGIGYRSDFTRGLDDWTGGFADLPTDADENAYELKYAYETLPVELNIPGAKAPILQGHNQSDDLFMFMTHSLTGLKPNTTYRATFEIGIASNAPAGAIGIGGAPGESVFLKAGITTQKPEPIVVDDHWRMNIDKGSQGLGGRDAITLGNIAVDTSIETPNYQLKTLTNAGQPFEFTTNENGTVWMIVGTDSGFEGLTKLYYTHIQVTLQEKLTVIYQSNFTIGLDNWTNGFADLPIDADATVYKLKYDYETLPIISGGSDVKAPVLQGHNHSADLFMFIKRPLTDLKPNTTYEVVFEVDIASKVPAGAIGIGGPPGESVFLKAGISTQEPSLVATEGDWRVNLDKGNYGRGGKDMVLLGNIAVDMPVELFDYQIKTLTNVDHPMEFTTGESDQAWLIVGTDSSFEGVTKLYYPRIKVTLQEKPSISK